MYILSQSVNPFSEFNHNNSLHWTHFNLIRSNIFGNLFNTIVKHYSLSKHELKVFHASNSIALVDECQILEGRRKHHIFLEAIIEPRLIAKVLKLILLIHTTLFNHFLALVIIKLLYLFLCININQRYNFKLSTNRFN